MCVAWFLVGKIIVGAGIKAVSFFSISLRNYKAFIILEFFISKFHDFRLLSILSSLKKMFCAIESLELREVLKILLKKGKGQSEESHNFILRLKEY